MKDGEPTPIGELIFSIKTKKKWKMVAVSEEWKFQRKNWCLATWKTKVCHRNGLVSSRGKVTYISPPQTPYLQEPHVLDRQSSLMQRSCAFKVAGATSWHIQVGQFIKDNIMLINSGTLNIDVIIHQSPSHYTGWKWLTNNSKKLQAK